MRPVTSPTILAPESSTQALQWVNGLLAIAALGFLMYYVVQVNAIAAQTWKLSDANERLVAVQDQRNGLVAQRASLDDRDSLTVAAQTAGLVPAVGVIYLLQDHSVATAR